MNNTGNMRESVKCQGTNTAQSEAETVFVSKQPSSTVFFIHHEGEQCVNCHMTHMVPN